LAQPSVGCPPGGCQVDDATLGEIEAERRGHLAGTEGICVEAKGIFILPRWARGQQTGPTRFE